MENEENFIRKFESQKISTWKNNYINYNLLRKELDALVEKNKKELMEEIEDMENSNSNYEEIKEIGMDDNLSTKQEILKIPDKTKNNNEKNIQQISFNSIIKKYIALLDEQVKNFYTFYKNKEKDLNKSINLQISESEDSANMNNNNKKMEIITQLKILSNLCKELLNYVYINIIVLMRILYIFDQKYTNISYNYIKKYLSKNNSDLIDILKFNIIDKSLIAIGDMLNSIKESLYQSHYFNNNKNEENKFKNDEKIINDNFNISNDIHEKIFMELNDWKKYLNISLELPTSNQKSIFKNTTFVCDPIYSSKSRSSLENNKLKILNCSKDSGIKIKNDDSIKLLDDNDNNNNININNIRNRDSIDIEGFMNLENEYFLINNGELFDPSDTFSYSTKKVLNKSNIKNFKIIIYLVGLYSYSYVFIIPNIINYMYYFNIFKQEYINPYIYLYSVAISIPIVGNMIAKCIYMRIIQHSYKITLILSLIFIVIYYLLSISGVIMSFFIYSNIPNNISFKLLFIIIGRFFLGLSNLKQLTKIYIEKYIPLTNQVQINARYNISNLLGYIIGLLINCFFRFNWHYSKITSNFIVNGISLIYSIIMLTIVINHFEAPNNFNNLKQTKINNNKNDNKRINANNNYLIEDSDNEINEIDNEIDIGDNELQEKSNLSRLIKRRKNKNINYYKRIFIILQFVLFTSQYISENLLLLLPLLVSYNIDNNYDKKYIIIIPLNSSFAFLISFLIQRYYLKNHYFQKKRKLLLIILSFIMMVLSLGFSPLCINFQAYLNFIKKRFYIRIVISMFILMIILNEVYRIISINLFTSLLPSEKIGDLNASSYIDFIAKIGRLFPSLIIVIYYNLKNKEINNILLGEEKYYNNINLCNSIIFGAQFLFLLINVLLFICSFSYIKNSPINRIINL